MGSTHSLGILQGEQKYPWVEDELQCTSNTLPEPLRIDQVLQGGQQVCICPNITHAKLLKLSNGVQVPWNLWLVPQIPLDRCRSGMGLEDVQESFRKPSWVRPRASGGRETANKLI